MDVGTAKPDASTLERAPHRLIDIRDPEQTYSAGDFVRDARAEIEAIFATRRIPLLAGGTMMYFRALTEGIAELPSADEATRREIDAMAEKSGWPAVHEELQVVDPAAASRINPNDSQRIQRALEVYKASGKALTEWQEEAQLPADDIRYLKIALLIEPRSLLHERIAIRLDHMVRNGFVDELRRLRQRPGVTGGSPSMRSVGYRQFWNYLEHGGSIDDAKEKALFATRQLAKRQITWLRSERSVFTVNPLEAGAIDTISKHLVGQLG